MAERNLDFDTVVDRRNTRCLKYDFAVRRGMPEDVLPLWVADMDFRTSSYVEDALVQRSKEAIFGYSEVQRPYFDIVKGWMERHHQWQVDEHWLVKTPGVVFALAMAVKAYTEPGEAVLIQSPVYYPFSEVIVDNERKLVSSDLKQDVSGHYYMDLEDLEEKIIKEKVRLLFLCNPHNPVGRVWTKEELTALGDICVKHGVIVVSDEIHADFVFEGYQVRALDYLLKPYNEQELVFAVEDAIRQVSVQLPARPAQPPAPAEPLRREEDEDMRTAIIRAEISRFIDAHYGEDISMQDAAAALRYSDAYFCKLFKQCFKVNFSAYLNEYRVNKARQLILDPRLSLKDIGAAVGYSDANYFTRVFKRLTGQTPSEYRMAAAEKAVQG